MTRATSTFLSRVKRFLDASPASKRDDLKILYHKLTGKALHDRTLDHWLAQDRGIMLDGALPLMRFLQLNDQIVPGTKDSGLFHYINSPVENMPKKKR